MITQMMELPFGSNDMSLLNPLKQVAQRTDELLTEKVGCCLGASDIEQNMLNFQNALLNCWLNETHELFGEMLRLAEQQYKRVSREFGTRNDRDVCIFSLGMLSSLIFVFQELFQAEEKDQRLVADFAKQSPQGKEIMFCLYSHNNVKGMKHGEIAAALGISPSALSNLMKRILQSGAVEAGRYGKSICYTLTEAGRRYCSERKRTAPASQTVQRNREVETDECVEKTNTPQDS